MMLQNELFSHPVRTKTARLIRRYRDTFPAGEGYRCGFVCQAMDGMIVRNSFVF